MIQNYVDEYYMREILSQLRGWVDSGNNIALKKILYKDNSILFFKNPDAIDTDTPEFKIDLPIEYFLDQTKTIFVNNFIWDEEMYPNTDNPNLDNMPVLVLAIKGLDDTVSYSFLNMKSLLNIYKASDSANTVIISIDDTTNIISASVNISNDTDNALSIGTDGGLYSAKTSTNTDTYITAIHFTDTGFDLTFNGSSRDVINTFAVTEDSSGNITKITNETAGRSIDITYD